MVLCNLRARLLPGLALAAFVLAAPAAEAFICGPTEFVLDVGEFNDCSGTQNYVAGGLGALEHDANLDGLFVPDDYFTDLHLTFLDSGVTVASAEFRNLSVSTDWDVEIMGNMVWFTAPDFNSRVIGGLDEFYWDLALNGTSGLNELRFTIEYTMDVPEPGAALLLTPAFLGLVGLAAARRRRLN